MKFVKYGSIQNANKEKLIDKVILQGFSSGEWVVQEKVHGANFSFCVNKDEVSVAKRTTFIQEGDQTFYDGYKGVYEENLEKIKQIYKICGGNEVRVFGELFGGVYKHPEVPEVKEAVKIQPGIYYAPFNEFYAFDILVDDQYLNVDEANKIFEEVGLFYAKSLFQGKFEDALKYPTKFESNIPKWLGLPEIEGNICEGVILKPVVSSYFHSNNEQIPNRVIIKNKTDAWKERSQKREQEGQNVLGLTTQAQELYEELCTYVTSNRLQNVISKIGNVSPEDFGKLMGLFNQDVLGEFHDEYGESFNELEKKEQKRIRKLLASKTGNTIKNYFLVNS